MAADVKTRPRRRGRRFWIQVLLANLLGLTLIFALGETGVRIWREGGLGPGLRSFVEDRPAPRGLGVNNWIIYDEERGYTLNPGRPGVSTLGVRHAELVVPKPAGARRLLHLGDSVSWDEDGFITLLRDSIARRGSPIEVINGAVPGYTTHQERLTLERLVDPVRPDLVTLQYCLNDNHRFLHQLTEDGGWLMTQEARMALLPEGGGLIARFSRWSYLAFEIRWRLHAGDARDGGPFPWEGQPDFKSAWKDETWSLIEDELDSMLGHLAPRSVPLLVLAVPYEPQLRDAALTKDRAYTLKPQSRLGAICAARGVPFLDLHAAFLAHRQTKLFTDGVHLTPEGHRLVAGELEARLDAEGFLRH